MPTASSGLLTLPQRKQHPPQLCFKGISPERLPRWQLPSRQLLSRPPHPARTEHPGAAAPAAGGSSQQPSHHSGKNSLSSTVPSCKTPSHTDRLHREDGDDFCWERRFGKNTSPEGGKSQGQSSVPTAGSCWHPSGGDVKITPLGAPTASSPSPSQLPSALVHTWPVPRLVSHIHSSTGKHKHIGFSVHGTAHLPPTAAPSASARSPLKASSNVT